MRRQNPVINRLTRTGRHSQCVDCACALVRASGGDRRPTRWRMQRINAHDRKWPRRGGRCACATVECRQNDVWNGLHCSVHDRDAEHRLPQMWVIVSINTSPTEATIFTSHSANVFLWTKMGSWITNIYGSEKSTNNVIYNSGNTISDKKTKIG